MNKYFGKIGFSVGEETRPGVWTGIVEREYYGDVTKLSVRTLTADKVNDNINVSNEISIVADPYAYMNFCNMRYIEFMGAKWKINSVQVQYPRLILTIGDLYNGEQT